MEGSVKSKDLRAKENAWKQVADEVSFSHNCASITSFHQVLLPLLYRWVILMYKHARDDGKACEISMLGR